MRPNSRSTGPDPAGRLLATLKNRLTRAGQWVFFPRPIRRRAYRALNACGGQNSTS
jgi:hypothetical protein